MTFLLDVNVLIALLDPLHVDHDIAHRWFGEVGSDAWASCPLTQNGVLRIVGHSRYPNTPGSPREVWPILEGLCALPGHVFWPDDLTMLDPQVFIRDELKSSAQLTDVYLLGLASAHGGMLATFDTRISSGAVAGGSAGLHLIAR